LGVRAELHRGPLDPLLPEWEALFQADPDATPFCSAGWARAWWPHWSGGSQPWIVTVRDGDMLVGLAPLVLARRRPFRVLTELGRPPGNYWNAVALPGARKEVSAAVAGAVRERSGEWHALLIGGLPLGSELEAALRTAGLRVRRRRPTPYPGMELPGSFEEYLQSLPRKRRKDLRRHMRRLEDGRLVLRDVTAPAELRAAIDRWQKIRVRWWESRRKDMDPEHASARFRDFMGDLVVALVPAGLAQVWELEHDGEVVGVEVNLMDARHYYSWMGAYAPEVAHLGLGKLAIGESIRASIEAGRSYYDMMVGDEEYKYWYGATDRYCRWMMVGNGRPGSRAAFAASAAADRIRRL
jgi:CelD/BcsL family acetyltransferase involved in cellulose biosynthesis